MDTEKQRKLEAGGWKVGTVAEFLDLSPEDAALVDIKVTLGRGLRGRRGGDIVPAELAVRLPMTSP